MKKEALELSPVCDYLLDEIELTLKKLRGSVAFGLFDLFSKTSNRSIGKKTNQEELDNHINHIKFGINKLQNELSEMDILEEEEEISAWAKTMFSDTFLRGDMQGLILEMEGLKEAIMRLSEKMNTL